MFTAEETQQAHRDARTIQTETGSTYREAYAAACKLIAARKREAAHAAYLRRLNWQGRARAAAAALLVVASVFGAAPVALALTCGG